MLNIFFLVHGWYNHSRNECFFLRSHTGERESEKEKERERERERERRYYACYQNTLQSSLSCLLSKQAATFH